MRYQNVLSPEAPAPRWRVLVTLRGILCGTPLAALALTMLVPLAFML